uniref:Uncharacterized protein n=1 Tax=Coccidioides posadasii RMSCC 3488 TaxID=454284 RepID=A0A0J6FI71_COCPO|nr:hypothetical protein CPAG_05404 [Coccidioides posadasii RMSCC 3488]
MARALTINFLIENKIWNIHSGRASTAALCPAVRTYTTPFKTKRSKVWLIRKLAGMGDDVKVRQAETRMPILTRNVLGYLDDQAGARQKKTNGEMKRQRAGERTAKETKGPPKMQISQDKLAERSRQAAPADIIPLAYPADVPLPYTHIAPRNARQSLLNGTMLLNNIPRKCAGRLKQGLNVQLNLAAGVWGSGTGRHPNHAPFRGYVPGV